MVGFSCTETRVALGCIGLTSLEVGHAQVNQIGKMPPVKEIRVTVSYALLLFFSNC